MPDSNPVRLLHPSIDEFDGNVVIRGVLDVGSLPDLRVDYYQRELLPVSSRIEIRRALETGQRLPDVTLGMRGDRFELEASGSLLLTDPVYLIDGRQRRDTIVEHLATTCDPKSIRLGAVVYVNTDAKFERDKFHAMNSFQRKVNPNVLIRNQRDEHPGIATLYGLTTTDRNFPLYQRVTWGQNATKGELISATTLLTVVVRLHHHVNARYVGQRRIGFAVAAVDGIVGKLGLPIFRDNVKTFATLLDEAWGVRQIHFKTGTPYLRRTFLEMLARIFNDHFDFWKQPDDRRLTIPYELKRKIAKFPINDPEVVRLSSASGAAESMLYHLMLTHVNSGKQRTNHLCARSPDVVPPAVDDEPDDDTEVA